MVTDRLATSALEEIVAGGGEAEDAGVRVAPLLGNAQSLDAGSTPAPGPVGTGHILWGCLWTVLGLL